MLKQTNKQINIHLPFLVFLIGVTSIKLQYKIVTIILYTVYLLFSKKKLQADKNGVLYFYLLMPIIGALGAYITGAFSWPTYWMGYVFSSIIWLMCAACFILIKNTIALYDTRIVKNTINSFFVLNAILCIVDLLKIIWESKHPFPYWHPSLEHIYGVSTGDHIHGIFQGNVSTVNATICLLSVFYFIFEEKKLLALLSLIVCLLCTSNLTVLILLGGISFCILLLKHYRKTFSIFLLVSLGAYLVLTPDNIKYSNKIISKIQEQLKQKKNSNGDPNTIVIIKDNKTKGTATKVEIRERNGSIDTVKTITNLPYIQKGVFVMDSILDTFREPIQRNKSTPELQSAKEVYESTAALRNTLGKWFDVPYEKAPLYEYPQMGKLVYLQQTLAYWKSNKVQMMIGTGPGNFSSKMALKMTGFQLEGTYPEKYRYISQSFFENHFYTYMFFWAKTKSDHSIINYPGCVYWHIGSEYGIVGLVILAFGYLGFFIKQAFADKRKWIFLVLLLGLFVFDYWFELLTLTVFFELFMLTLSPQKFKKADPSVHEENVSNA